MSPASRETSQKRSFWLAVWSELLRIVDHPALVVAARSWVCEIAAVAFADGVLAGGATARLGVAPIASAPIPARATQEIALRVVFVVVLMEKRGLERRRAGSERDRATDS